MKILKQHSLYTAIIVGLSSVMYQSAYADDNYKKIGDLEIYKQPDKEGTTIAMMLDISGSMLEVDMKTLTYGYQNLGSIKSLSNNQQGTICYYGLHRTARGGNGVYFFKDASNIPVSIPITDAQGNTQDSVQINVSYCPDYNDSPQARVENNNTFNPVIINGTPTRMSNLKLGLIGFLANGNAIDEKNSIGMGHFSNRDAVSGSMVVPAKPLTLEHRKRLIEYVNGLVPFSATPIASAYAEVAAYMLGTNTRTQYQYNGNSVSGFLRSHADTKKAGGATYQSPLEGLKSSECVANGIYFLTDGQPNNHMDGATTDMITSALGLSRRYTVPTQGLDKVSGDSGWQYIGGLAQELLKPSQLAPKGLKTATVGFGGEFENFNTKQILVEKGGGTTQLQTVPDCNSPGVGQHERNLCLWGELKGIVSDPQARDNGRTVGNFGQGGFTNTSTPEGLQTSLTNFFENLNTTISAMPAGTISIPSDPLNSLTIQPYAYLPMMQPESDKSLSVWDGNLRKYHTLFGTLFGQNRQRLYIADSARATNGNEKFPHALNPAAKDIWHTDNSSAASVTAGGARSQLMIADASTKTSRVVYIEGGTAQQPKLLKAQVVNGVLNIDASGNNLSRYTIEDLAYLVDYLGFSVPKTASSYSGNDLTSQIASLNQLLAQPATTMRTTPVFGGVVHSVPVLASYKGVFDEKTGNINTDPKTREDYLLYGSMDGALHMTDARTGGENFAFIPRVMFDTQRVALEYGSNNSRIGQPYFGIDAPWITSAEYKYNDKGVDAKAMSAYGGLRMGGVGFYGLDIKNPTSPSLKFAISNNTSGFERLGQTWAKPTFAKIKTGAEDADYRDVLIFGGGYDMCYENPRFTLNDANNADVNCANKTQANGNAIYMIDAKDGSLIANWQASAPASVTQPTVGSATDDRNEMRHSFVSEIIALDRNNNGYVDSLYASDLGGQLFRIDLQEGVSGSAMTRRVVRVFNANSNLPNGMLPMRFYEKPTVSFYAHNGGRIAMVNIASGDRSSPLHTHRDELTHSNRIYGIIDRDLATFRALKSGMSHLITRNLTNNDLHAYDTAELERTSAGTRKKLIDDLKSGDVHGWWYPMTRFDTYTNVKNLKAIGSSVTMGHVFYTSIYSPDYQYTKEQACSARVVGATERQMFCLPWGICANPETGSLIPESKNGTLGFSRGGPGIQEIAMTTITASEDQSTNFKTIISMQTIADRVTEASSNTTNTNTGANSSTNPMVQDNGVHRGGGHNNNQRDIDSEMRKVLKVDRWYDLATAEANQ